ncbi:MAG: ATP phosphoribosyltransferase regulatory subunit [Bacilli bacterium]|nr:ATP phosphoribosyltransferase regulatory subunit [Bacilli bacterium]
MEEFQYLIPEESSDAIITNVTTLRNIEGKLREMFNEAKYQEVLLPSFEYVDLYYNMDIGIDEEKMFQFINHEGKRIALRADFTLPLARLYVSSHKNGIQRYSYFGKVYRKEKKHKGRTTEFYQGGIELMGKGGIEGEKECMEIIQQSMSCLGLNTIKLVVGSAKFFKRICELADDPVIVKILKMRSFSMMKEFVEKKKIEGYFKDLLLMIPKALGDIKLIEETIETIEDIILKESLLELKKLYESLENKDIYFDLAMVPSMKYYTGMMMRGYSPYSAQPIVSGGRYDHLMHHFHKNVPAIGFSYDFHYILHALEMEEEAND